MGDPSQHYYNALTTLHGVDFEPMLRDLLGASPTGTINRALDSARLML